MSKHTPGPWSWATNGDEHWLEWHGTEDDPGPQTIARFNTIPDMMRAHKACNAHDALVDTLTQIVAHGDAWSQHLAKKTLEELS